MDPDGCGAGHRFGEYSSRFACSAFRGISGAKKFSNERSSCRTILPACSPPQFEIVQSQVRTIPSPRGHALRITPVNRLRVVMVQTGYRRVPGGDPLNSTLVPGSFPHSGRTCIPASKCSEKVYSLTWILRIIRTIDYNLLEKAWQAGWRPEKSRSLY